MNPTPVRRAYPFHTIEPRWQSHWLENKTFRAHNPGDPGFDPAQPKYYILDMFPYPSGSGLHVGHPEGYTATDILSRFKRMNGYNVLHPMGWDAFGLPAEQYAIKTGQHPRITTEANVENFRRQLQSLGFSYDWDREVNTTDPGYYKWTQWIFLQIYNSWLNPDTGKAEPVSTYKGDDVDSVRLAYVSEAPVNWCPELGTVLANEEVVDGKSDVGGFKVERRPMRQWMLRITKYGQRLIDELDGLDWPEGIKMHQRNWIGRSDGAEVDFTLPSIAGEHLTVYTTRPDTLFGATYMVLAPEHPLVSRLTTPEQRDAVNAYCQAVATRSDLDRTDLNKDKTGVFTGAFATNPVNGQPIPIWIADYVLISYGTGAIMAVPAHDTRDFEFAEKFNLPVVQVVQPPSADTPWQGFVGDGTSLNSGFLDGLPTPEAKAQIIRWLEERSGGRGRINFKLRDWLFSRQRYWGEPFPVVWENGRHRALTENELPLTPPELADFKPTGTPEPPLSKATDWVRYSPTATRELNTMPQWAGSCWYYLRYLDARNDTRFASVEAENYWMNAGKPGGVDLYVGGTEHAVLHLLYARFWHKVLFDLGYVSTPEPFQRLVNQGLILGEDGVKMSKSRGNVVNPDDVIREYGADSLRLYEMFMGPLSDTKPWKMTGVEGVSRFLARVWRLVMEEETEGVWKTSPAVQDVPLAKDTAKVVHATIKKVTEDIENMAFNTAISQMMICTNTLTALNPRPRAGIAALLHVLNPFAPHLTEDLWKTLGLPGEIALTPWPAWAPAALIEDSIEIPVQINGKKRATVSLPPDSTEEAARTAALAHPDVARLLDGQTVKRVVVVPNRMINVVAAAQ